MTRPVLLLILDGWGLAAAGPGNALSLARTPHLDGLLAQWPRSQLACCGRAVGLPAGFMGNSEVGHMNIGAGRVVYQDMTRIDMAVEDGGFFQNPVFNAAVDAALASGGRLHLLGLVSDGGVHSHQNHIYALLELAKRRGLSRVVVHAFLDGRDTPPTSGKGYVQALVDKMAALGVGSVASVTGRYWAMDRDKRWERVARAYGALVAGDAPLTSDPVAAVQAAYEAGENDEFVQPRLMTGPDGGPLAPITDGDAVLFFNFRADRAREICRSLSDPAFAEFQRPRVARVAYFGTMTEYDRSLPLPAAFPPQSTAETLGEVVAGAGLRQLRIAETEKYAHVTYFLNCGREEPFPGEERVLVPSPREVATYDAKPEMSVHPVTDQLLPRLDQVDLAVCNLANLDMVGHTGIIPAAVAAAEAVDHCVGRIVARVLELGGAVLLTADHGNAEEMLDAQGGVQTAHSLNPVPLVCIGGPQSAGLRAEGLLADIAPTALALLGLPQPQAMTGRSLLEPCP